MVFNDIRDRMDRQDVVIASLHEEHPQRAPNARRQERHARVDDFDDNHKDEFEDEKDLRWQGGIDRNLGNIKMKIPSFQGKIDPEAYLEWEKKVELIFDTTTTLRRKR